MSPSAPPPFPDRLRLRPIRRRPRRRLQALALLPALALTLPLWRVQTVRVSEGAPLPPAARSALAALVGTWTPAVDLQRIRAQVTAWPAVGGADVRLTLPGSVEITVQPAVPVASVAIGSGWHGVAADGRLAGRLEHPTAPVLDGVPHRPVDLRRATRVGDRVAAVTGLAVDRVRLVMPDDFEVDLRTPCEACPSAVVHVAAEATAAEALWVRRMSDCGTVARWADARSSDRLVVAPGGAP